MNSQLHIRRVVQAGVAIAAIALCAACDTDERSEATTKSARPAAAAASGPVAVVDGVAVVEVSLAAQRSGGIAVQPLASASGPAGATSDAIVMDAQPLADWWARLSAARSQAAAAQAQAAAASADLARTRALHDDDRNASLKSLQAAQAAADAANAGAQAAQAALQGLQRQGALQFGAWVADDHGALLSGRHALLRVAMPSGEPATRAATASCGGGPRLAARWIAASPQADAQLGANVQLYEADQPLPANASCSVAFAAPASASRGVLVPSEAVLWFADQPWVYVQRDATHFARTAMPGAIEQPRGFFAPANLAAGAQVVTRGVGLLLAQEQAPPPGGGTACKDPECDD
jgi:hypothetical protein